MRRDVADHAFFGACFPDQSDASLGQVANAAVQQSAGAAACTGSKVGLFDDRGSQAAHRGIARDARADDSAADHQHIEWFATQLG